MISIEATYLVVGVPIYDEEREGYKYKDEYKINPIEQYPENMEPNQLYQYSAGYKIHSEGTPKFIIGRAIIMTWHDGIEITRAHLRQIKREKKLVKKILNEKGRLWVIGHQT